MVYRLNSSAGFVWWTDSQRRSRNMVKRAVISRRRRRHTRWICSLVVWMWQKIEKVLKMFSFRTELHAGTKRHVRECCLSAVLAAVLTAAFADMEGLVARCFQARRNDFTRALQPSHLHMYRIVRSPYLVFSHRVLHGIIRVFLLVRHSVLHSTNERYSGTIYCNIWKT